MLPICRLSRYSPVNFYNSCRCYYNPSNKVRREGKIWREQHKLPSHINHHKSLLEGADYRFLDGRPTPYGLKQYMRIERQRELAKQIVEFKGEVDFAVERYNRIQQEKKQEIQNILDRKLKPKGGIIKN